MTIILKANKLNLFLSPVLFVFWYHSPNLLDTPRILSLWISICHRKKTTETENAAEQGDVWTYESLRVRCKTNNRLFICSSGWTNEGERDGRNIQQARGT
jgi:hypothetical protein